MLSRTEPHPSLFTALHHLTAYLQYQAKLAHHATLQEKHTEVQDMRTELEQLLDDITAIPSGPQDVLPDEVYFNSADARKDAQLVFKRFLSACTAPTTMSYLVEGVQQALRARLVQRNVLSVSELEEQQDDG